MKNFRASQQRIERGLIAALGATYLVLALWYSVSTPMLEPYDEPFHFAYVLSLALDHALPVQDVDQIGPWGNEGNHPPLYYLLAAAVTAWTDQAGFAQQIERNPYTTRHLPVEPNDNRNLFVHHRSERFPYRDTVLGLHLARGLSALFGVGAICATYLTAKQIFPARPAIALGAAAFHAFIPSFIYVSSAVSNDALVTCLASLSVWYSVRVARASSLSIHNALCGGLKKLDHYRSCGYSSREVWRSFFQSGDD